MSTSTLFKISSADIHTEAEVETRFLPKLFSDLGYSDKEIIPKHRLPGLLANDGSKKKTIEVDFLLVGSDGNAKVIVEAKDPTKSVQEAWGQAASYALSYNSTRDKESEKIKWLLISNGHMTSIYRWDSNTPAVTLQLSDFASGSPAYTTLRSYIKHQTADETYSGELKFEIVPPEELNKIFAQAHDLIWKREKLSPTDAFFEFCKFIFIKIEEDRRREKLQANTPLSQIPLTSEWLEAQKTTSKHPVRDVLFITLRDKLEAAIKRDQKRRIFEPTETLKLSAATCKELIKRFEKINLKSIDEDLNGRMFEVFLNAAVRGRALGQYFTPRPVVDFMTRISLSDTDVSTPPKTIDACAGTAGFLIEVMAYLLSGLRDDTRFNAQEKAELKAKICNEMLYGVEANERVARIARINMYLHGDGGSHIFHGDGLDNEPQIYDDMTEEQYQEAESMRKTLEPESFDLVLTNPPFSMVYDRSNSDEERILAQRGLVDSMKSAKSNILFLDRYHELLKPGGQMLVVLDDTVLNGINQQDVRKWLLDRFVVLGVHSLPFNAFFKAKANIKTSILHLRKKRSADEAQGHVFMSISNNIGHDNALRDTLNRNNLTDILASYLEWKRTGRLETVIKENQDKNENLECPEQIWLLAPEDLKLERLDAFYYAPELKKLREELIQRQKTGDIAVLKGSELVRKAKFSKPMRDKLNASGELFKYVEISNVTNYGLIVTYQQDVLGSLPSRGQYQVNEGDILMAINISSRGTVVLVPRAFQNAICTSGFLVIEPRNDEERYLLWYSLRSEACKKQIYYLSQTASQPELKLESWNKEFLIPMPMGEKRHTALKEAKTFHEHLSGILAADTIRF